MRTRIAWLGVLAGLFLSASLTTSAWADPVRYLDETITLGTPPHMSVSYGFAAPAGRAGIVTIERLSGFVTGTVSFNGQPIVAQQAFAGNGPMTITRNVALSEITDSRII